MKRPRPISLIIVFGILLACLSACSGAAEDMDIIPSDSSLQIGELVSVVYSSSALKDIAAYEGNAAGLNAKYAFECVREENSFYRVAYLGEESVALIWFDQSGNKYLSKLYSLQCNKVDFQHLQIGDSLQLVKTIDPSGDYLFWNGRDDLPQTSIHCTLDGYMLTITYDETLCVSELVWSYI